MARTVGEAGTWLGCRGAGVRGMRRASPNCACAEIIDVPGTGLKMFTPIVRIKVLCVVLLKNGGSQLVLLPFIKQATKKSHSVKSPARSLLLLRRQRMVQVRGSAPTIGRTDESIHLRLYGDVVGALLGANHLDMIPCGLGVGVVTRQSICRSIQ